ncbi:hypothetical protein [Roseovarius aestuarii]|uniref:Uncharacterized protein n=1 Tax=Roseovarius aestuarii TaxID=475083 RepID=A0A1X7BRQ6_9RHOB|nr:hypothetical protein [Roseovarius aestuarii]SMC12376.1 hypothetical protein ROA7745_02201 [Roseovarius aestuarii]
MIPRAGLILMLSFPATAFAGNCAGLGTLAQSAAGGFADGKPDESFNEVESCDLLQNSDGTQTYLCTWQFAYRAPGAAAVFDMLDRLIPVCIRGAQALPADDSVNHPDSYDLRRYRRGDVVISTSLKDKAALEQTLVTLRIDSK